MGARMNSPFLRQFCPFVVLVLLMVFSPGCRNQYGCQSGNCGQPWQPMQPWNAFSQNTVVPPPATNSARLSAQPQGSFYTAPTQPATNPGWTPAGQPMGSGVPGNFGASTGFGTQPTFAPTGFSQSVQPGMPVGGYPPQVAGMGNIGNGSRVVSPDFVTTSTNVAQDPTRMPMADATQQRAPSAYSSFGAFSPAQNNQAYGYLTPNGSGTTSNPTVLARATTAPEANPNYQNGWRSTPAGNQSSFSR